MRKACKLTCLIIPIFTCISCVCAQDNLTVSGHPAWIIQGNIYEVNVRQYTPEGTFKAFEKHLQRLKDMGVQTLWFMPITPISKTDRKGDLGSYYAVADYTAVNPEFGTMDDWKELVNHAHAMGFKVITDWVPNHSGGDNYWLTAHPDFYLHDANGKVASPYDWSDTRKLNYNNPELQDSMIGAMKFWLVQTGIDGFRCDVAGDVPDEFWQKCISQLKKIKNVFMLAEGNKPSLPTDGFDATYPWKEFSVMKAIAAGHKTALALDSIISQTNKSFPQNALLMYFTSNHDENSWNKADYATMPGASHAPFAVLTYTLPHSVPLIYSGQEEPFLDSISFFYKDTIAFSKYGRAQFYSTLLHLREHTPALAATASFKKLSTTNDTAIFAFERTAGSSRIVVITNLSSEPQDFKINDDGINGKAENVFTTHQESISRDKNFHLQAWAYLIYNY